MLKLDKQGVDKLQVAAASPGLSDIRRKVFILIGAAMKCSVFLRRQDEGQRLRVGRYDIALNAGRLTR